MKRIIVIACMACLLLVSSWFSTVEIAHARTTRQFSGPLASTSASASSPVLSTSQLKDVVRKTFGQHAVDRMLYPVTHPLANRRPHYYNPSTPAIRGTASSTALISAAMGQEVYATTNNASGYIGDLGQTATGASAQFNAEPVTLPSAALTVTWVGLGYRNGSNVDFPIIAGVDQVSMFATYLVGPPHTSMLVDVFKVNAGDQISSEVYQWNDNQWFIFIFDQTTGQYFNQIITYSVGTTLKYTGWVLAAAPPGPLTSFLPVTFSQAIWVGSNSSGWQPITASPFYDQLFLQSPNGGRAWTTEIPTPPGNSFSILYCPGCTP